MTAKAIGNLSGHYRKIPKNSDTRKICCNHPKIRTKWLYKWEMCPKDIDGIADSVDPDQTAPLGLHCLPRPICLKTWEQYSIAWSIHTCRWWGKRAEVLSLCGLSTILSFRKARAYVTGLYWFFPYPLSNFFPRLSGRRLAMIGIIIPPANCLWQDIILFSRCPSVTFWFFSILKRQRWNFIKFGKHIDIYKMNIYIRKIRARGQFFQSYCPL